MSKKIAIVGAGPVGSLLAVFLAKRGHSVEMFERRPDMRVKTIDSGRSINLALSTRGIHALQSVGLKERVMERAIPMRGRSIHMLSGQELYQPYGRDESECIYSVSRGELNQLLMTSAEATGKVRIEFERTITRLNVLGNFDTLFGTDGSASALRQEVVSENQGTVNQKPLDYGYKELTLPAGSGQQFLIEKNSLHIWPRKSFMLIALPNFDGSFTCTLFLPHQGHLSFESLKSEESIQKFFSDHFSDVLKWIPNLVEQYLKNPVGHMVTVKSSNWNLSDRALLIGDAAHAIVPFFGQGMNCGFEDVSQLDQFLDVSAQDWAKPFDHFYKHRKPDADAIADLAEENFVEMRDRVTDPLFQLERRVEKILEAEFPNAYLSRYTLVTFSRVPYSLAKSAGIIENEILTELCSGLESPEQVNLKHAKTLIDKKLSPLLQPFLKF